MLFYKLENLYKINVKDSGFNLSQRDFFAWEVKSSGVRQSKVLKGHIGRKWVKIKPFLLQSSHAISICLRSAFFPILNLVKLFLRNWDESIFFHRYDTLIDTVEKKFSRKRKRNGQENGPDMDFVKTSKKQKSQFRKPKEDWRHHERKCNCHVTEMWSRV